jgi:RNA polymerase sigma-70 factor (ECF subfamily)
VLDEAELSEQTASSFGNPEKSAIEAEDKARILSAMVELSEEDRLLITLYHLQECDYSEISEITNIPPSNLKVKLFRARQRLKKLCAGEEAEGDSDEMRTDTTQSSGLQPRAAESA